MKDVVLYGGILAKFISYFKSYNFLAMKFQNCTMDKYMIGKAHWPSSSERAVLGSQLVLLSREAWRTANSSAVTGETTLLSGDTDGEDQRLQASAPAEGVEGSEATGGKGAATLM
jgi:hypothetical protein